VGLGWGGVGGVGGRPRSPIFKIEKGEEEEGAKNSGKDEKRPLILRG